MVTLEVGSFAIGPSVPGEGATGYRATNRLLCNFRQATTQTWCDHATIISAGDSMMRCMKAWGIIGSQGEAETGPIEEMEQGF